MDECSYEEIISTLAKFGRPDFIADFKELTSIEFFSKRCTPIELDKHW